MDLPKFNETFLPILDILRNGEIVTGRKLLELVEHLLMAFGSLT
jgi:restriction system protein